MTVVVLSFAAFLYMAYDCVQLYMKDVTRRAETVRLPSMTVCNVNPLRSPFFLSVQRVPVHNRVTVT